MKTFFTRWSIRNPVITAALYIGVLILSILTLIINQCGISGVSYPAVFRRFSGNGDCHDFHPHLRQNDILVRYRESGRAYGQNLAATYITTPRENLYKAGQASLS